MSKIPPDTPMGGLEICFALGVKYKRVRGWVDYGVLPEHTFTSVNGSRAWTWEQISEWAVRTGKISYEDMLNAPMPDETLWRPSTRKYPYPIRPSRVPADMMDPEIKVDRFGKEYYVDPRPFGFYADQNAEREANKPKEETQ